MKDFSTKQFKDNANLVKSYAEIKKASALANFSLGLIDQATAQQIIGACNCIIEKPAQTQLECLLLGADALKLNTVFNDYVAKLSGVNSQTINLCQAAEDVFNTAQNLVIFRLVQKSSEGIGLLAQTLRDKAIEFESILHVGRSHMQEALPVSWGAVFGAMYLRLNKGWKALKKASDSFLEVNLGCTPIDPFIVAAPGFKARAVNELRKITGLELRNSGSADGFNHYAGVIENLEANDRYLRLMNALRIVSLNLARMGNDFYLYSSGPRCGIAEIFLPAIAPGSTIMPGKINPSMPELMMQIFHQTMTADQMTVFSLVEEDIDMGASVSTVFLNVAEVIDTVGRGCERFVVKCVAGISINEKNCETHLKNSASLISVARAVLGEKAAKQIWQECCNKQISVSEAAVSLGLTTTEEAEDIFDLSRFRDWDALRRYLHQAQVKLSKENE